jgi:hypothetical protein
MSGSKLSIIMAATALVVAVFFATPLAQAAGRLVLPKNSVGAVQIKKNAVTGPKVKNGSLLSADFKAGQLPGGPQGPKGDKGDVGAQGAQGVAGIPGLPGTARAYGLVNGTAVTRSKNVISVSSNVSGEYCILLDPSIDIPTAGAVVTPEYSQDATGANVITHAEWSKSPIHCSAGIHVLTFQVIANGATGFTNVMADEPFFFVVP